MKLLVLISGNADKIIEKLGLKSSEFKIIKIDEKDLSSKSHIMNILKSDKFEQVIFGVLDLEFLRFNFFINLYLILAGYKEGLIADNLGNFRKMSLSSFIFKEIPLFKIEIVASAFVVLYHYIKFPVINKLWKMKH